MLSCVVSKIGPVALRPSATARIASRNAGARIVSLTVPAANAGATRCFQYRFNLFKKKNDPPDPPEDPYAKFNFHLTYDPDPPQDPSVMSPNSADYPDMIENPEPGEFALGNGTHAVGVSGCDHYYTKDGFKKTKPWKEDGVLMAEVVDSLEFTLHSPPPMHQFEESPIVVKISETGWIGEPIHDENGDEYHWVDPNHDNWGDFRTPPNRE